MPDRLAWPLRVGPNGRLVTVEQDSDDDIAQCVRAIRNTRLGERPDLPTMGVPDPTFEEQPLDVDALRDQIARHEPRIAAVVSTQPDALDAFVADLDIEWDRLPDPDAETPQEG